MYIYERFYLLFHACMEVAINLANFLKLQDPKCFNSLFFELQLS